MQQAIRLAPTDAFAHRNLGYVLAAKDRHDAAIEEYRRAIALDPKSAHAHTNLAASLLKTRRIGAAIDGLREAVRLDSTYAPGHNGLGVRCERGGHRTTSKPSVISKKRSGSIPSTPAPQ